ncbi:hypothetical protein [Sphingomonas sp. R86520]|uniref:hypothetical protein n=1 Tax=Sphingomonas sp. R86520 TaxID=3093859 RepID=UPI0036D43464
MVRGIPLATSSLLARKGAARPAMMPEACDSSLSANGDAGGGDDAAPIRCATEPVSSLAAGHPLKIELRPIPAIAVSVADAARIARDVASKARHKRAAFTLRLDADRHLRLRLASAVANASSQRLVTQALDAFLHTLPEVDALLAQLPPGKAQTSEQGSSR